MDEVQESFLTFNMSLSTNDASMYVLEENTERCESLPDKGGAKLPLRHLLHLLKLFDSWRHHS